MFVAPMFPRPCPEPFDDERYLFEPKLNGRRLILSFINQITTLYNQHRQEVTRQYPELCRVPLQTQADVVLDGEIVYINPETGLMELETVVDRFRLRREPSIREASRLAPLHFFVFDVLHYNGEDVRGWPLMRRKELLRRLLAENERFHPVAYREADGTKAYEAAGKLKLDGIVAKRKDSVYVGASSADWLAVPCYEYTDAYISGYRKRRFGWLIHRQGEPAGLIEQPVARESRMIFQSESIARIAGEDRDFVYLQPALRARIRHRGLTRDGRMRNPEFVSFLSSEPAALNGGSSF